jgi:hypothetical protein
LIRNWYVFALESSMRGDGFAFTGGSNYLSTRLNLSRNFRKSGTRFRLYSKSLGCFTYVMYMVNQSHLYRSVKNLKQI